MTDRRSFHSLPAFTILELLTAMAVLAMILVMMVQVVNGLLQSTKTQNQQMDSVATARRAMDVIATDLNNAVVGENAAILAPDAAGSSNVISLLTCRRGTTGVANHRFLAVSYTTNSGNQLVRSYGSAGFEATNLLVATIATTPPVTPLAKGILAIQARAIADGTNFYALSSPASGNWSTNIYNGMVPPIGFKALVTRTPTFASGLTNRTRAIEIWVAAVDEQNYKLLESANKLAAVRSLLGADPSTWRTAIDAAAIPPQTKSAIRVLNKNIPVR